MKSQIQLVTGDITLLQVDAIVNAANSTLLGGGGVDGAIHNAAGPELVEASSKLAPCPAGEARLTAGFDLPAKHVIHAVGPIYFDGNSDEAKTLKLTYVSILEIAADNRFHSIAIPCISTGAYRFPKELACEIAVDTVSQWQSKNEHPTCVIFCCFGESDAELYVARLTGLGLVDKDESI